MFRGVKITCPCRRYKIRPGRQRTVRAAIAISADCSRVSHSVRDCSVIETAAQPLSKVLGQYPRGTDVDYSFAFKKTLKKLKQI